jgi:hypothetical protein
VLRSPTGNRTRAVKPCAIKLTLGVVFQNWRSLPELMTPDSVAHSSVRRELDKPVGATAAAGSSGYTKLIEKQKELTQRKIPYSLAVQCAFTARESGPTPVLAPVSV